MIQNLSIPLLWELRIQVSFLTYLLANLVLTYFLCRVMVTAEESVEIESSTESGSFLALKESQCVVVQPYFEQKPAVEPLPKKQVSLSESDAYLDEILEGLESSTEDDKKLLESIAADAKSGQVPQPDESVNVGESMSQSQVDIASFTMDDFEAIKAEGYVPIVAPANAEEKSEELLIADEIFGRLLKDSIGAVFDIFGQPETETGTVAKGKATVTFEIEPEMAQIPAISPKESQDIRNDEQEFANKPQEGIKDVSSYMEEDSAIIKPLSMKDENRILLEATIEKLDFSPIVDRLNDPNYNVNDGFCEKSSNPKWHETVHFDRINDFLAAYHSLIHNSGTPMDIQYSEDIGLEARLLPRNPTTLKNFVLRKLTEELAVADFDDTEIFSPHQNSRRFDIIDHRILQKVQGLSAKDLDRGIDAISNTMMQRLIDSSIDSVVATFGGSSR